MGDGSEQVRWTSAIEECDVEKREGECDEGAQGGNLE